MKYLSNVLIVLSIAFAVGSCGSVRQHSSSAPSSTSSVSTTASVNGQAAGTALKALYGQYKVDGKLDMANLTNIINMATLATNVQGLKGQSDKTAFYKDFAAGLILGSENLISNNNSEKVMNGLTSLVNNVDLSGIETAASNIKDTAQDVTEKGTAAIQNATAIASSVSNILSLFKK